LGCEEIVRGAHLGHHCKLFIRSMLHYSLN
jgi:hypothetical protein